LVCSYQAFCVNANTNDVSDLPPSAAMICALPSPTAVANPFGLTEHTFGSVELQLKPTPLTATSFVSYAVATNSRPSPTASESFTGVSTTRESGGTTTGLSGLVLHPAADSTTAASASAGSALAARRVIGSTRMGSNPRRNDTAPALPGGRRR